MEPNLRGERHWCEFTITETSIANTTTCVGWQLDKLTAHAELDHPTPQLSSESRFSRNFFSFLSFLLSILPEEHFAHKSHHNLIVQLKMMNDDTFRMISLCSHIIFPTWEKIKFINYRLSYEHAQFVQYSLHSSPTTPTFDITLLNIWWTLLFQEKPRPLCYSLVLIIFRWHFSWLFKCYAILEINLNNRGRYYYYW